MLALLWGLCASSYFYYASPSLQRSGCGLRGFPWITSLHPWLWGCSSLPLNSIQRALAVSAHTSCGYLSLLIAMPSVHTRPIFLCSVCACTLSDKAFFCALSDRLSVCEFGAYVTDPWLQVLHLFFVWLQSHRNDGDLDQSLWILFQYCGSLVFQKETILVQFYSSIFWF